MRKPMSGGHGPYLFSTFFVWSVGSGSMQLARPLFAQSFGVDVFLVALVTASNAMARLIAAPITGLMVDRFGRRPLVVAGALMRGLSALAIYFSSSYEQFLVLEFLGGVGISVFNTGSSVIIADVSGTENRGRAVAVRTTSLRLGQVSGPFFGTLLAAMFDLRAIFLFNAVTKFITLAMVLLFIGETQPERSGQREAQPKAPLDLSLFMSRGFVAVMAVTLAINMAGSGGAFAAVFPLHAQASAGMSITDIGNMITLSGIIGFLVAYPNGMLVDRFGRKSTLLPGLLLLTLGVTLLAGITDYASVVVAVALLGLGEGASAGTSQVFAMDLSPEGRV
jgi:MFS family permease